MNCVNRCVIADALHVTWVSMTYAATETAFAAKPPMPKINKWLTPAAHRMLLQMRDGTDNYILVDKGEVWVDLERFSRRTLNVLLRLCLIHAETYVSHGMEMYTLNEDGERILNNPNYEPPIIAIQVRQLKKLKGLK
jgi:hypothetical protein